MRRKTLIALFTLVGIVMICSPAQPFHDSPANPDPQQREVHAVNEECRVLEHSDYHTAKAICRDDLVAIVNVRDPSHLRLVGVVHHHDDGTIHAWMDTVFAETGACNGIYQEVSTVEEMDRLLYRGAATIRAKEAQKHRYEGGI